MSIKRLLTIILLFTFIAGVYQYNSLLTTQPSIELLEKTWSDENVEPEEVDEFDDLNQAFLKELYSDQLQTNNEINFSFKLPISFHQLQHGISVRAPPVAV